MVRSSTWTMSYPLYSTANTSRLKRRPRQARQRTIDNKHSHTNLDTITPSSVDYHNDTAYDAAGRVQALTLGNNVLVTDYTYFPWTTQNGLGRLKRITTWPPADPTAFQDLRYGNLSTGESWYDPAGNLQTIKDYYAGNPQTQSFAYDNADRLISAQVTGGTGGIYGPETYIYNGTTGNLTNKGEVTQTCGDANHKHAVTSTSAGSTFQHDANGNQTQRVVGGQTYNLIYDA